MENLVNVSWKEGMAFDAHIGSHHIKLDAKTEVGGSGEGPQPKPLLLVALAGCTGMDVVSILKKMKVDIEDFDIDIQASMTDEHPKFYNKIHLIYKFKGHNLSYEKLEKAVALSQDRYCGVSAMLRKAAELSYEITVVN